MKFIGDIHGNPRVYYTLGDGISLQVGDFGLFGGRYIDLDNRLSDALSSDDYFIRGNHDNPTVCKSHEQYIPDGSMFNNVYCLGGGYSIDQKWRTKDIDYWTDEECSDDEFQVHLDKYIELKPNYVCTHEAPWSVVQVMFGDMRLFEPSRTSKWLDIFLMNHRPKKWIFGHWHKSRTLSISGTEFICLNINEVREIECI